MIGTLVKMNNAVTKEDVMRVYNQYIKGKQRCYTKRIAQGTGKCDRRA